MTPAAPGESDGLATIGGNGADALDAPTPGTTIGRYQVIGRIGSGAMGVVFAAYDPHLDRRVALKVLHAGEELASSGSATPERLMREAQALAKLAHPNVVTVHDVGIVDGQVFVAMELVAGVTLREWCKHAERSWRDVLDKLIVAARGLAAAHVVGLVHRDFKPDNIMVGDDGRVRVLDFGLARSAESQAAPSPGELEELEDIEEHLTQAGAILGTPAYMAPEQFVGGSVDARTDQFALCVTIWELAYGQRPFRAKTPVLLGCEILRADPEEPTHDRGVPAWLRPLLLRGLAKVPEDRHPCVEALVEAIEEQLRPAPTRSRRLAAGLVVATGVALTAGIWSARRDERPRCDRAQEDVDEVWNGDRRDAVLRAFAATERSYAGDTAQRVTEAIDDWTERWIDRHTDACESTHVRHEQSLASMELRMRCLDQQRKQLDTHVTLLEEADADLVGRAAAATAELGRPETCDDVERLSRTVPLPDDRETARRIQEIEDDSQRWRAMLAAGRQTVLRTELLPAVDEVLALDYAPLSASVLPLLSRTFSKLDERAAAFDAAHRAAVAALAAGDAVAIANNMVLRCRTLIYAGQYDEAKRCLDLAEGAADREGRSSALEAQLLTATGHVAVEQGRYDEAMAASARALEIVQESMGEGRELVMALFSHGEVCRVSERLDDAEAALRRAVDLGERSLGPGHPDLAASLNSLAVVHIEQGRTEDALGELRRVLEIRKEVFGDDHDYVAGTYNNMGYAALRGERHAEALSLFERAVQMRVAAKGEGYARVPGMLRSVAECLLALDRLPEALEVARRSVEGYGDTARSRDRCESLETLAKVHERMGDPEAARQATSGCPDPAAQ
jgi:eukaryotic-like serine/threonine-protein kinase